ncbi:MAG TPA: restriction endonuclease subunit S [Syntrophorhabdaceae bacterium]|nr:restriction endonuclease subunit S [Syntrophorhabdaceae bacterium]
MITNLKPYPAYRDSGVEWLGKVPEHWDNCTIRNIACFLKGKNPKNVYSNIDAPPGALPYLTMEYLRGKCKIAKTYSVESEDVTISDNGGILLLWDGANAGEFFIAKIGIVSSTCALVKINGQNHAYVYLVLKQYEPFLKSFTIGMGIPHVDINVLKQLNIPLPPLPEQALIVRFLDWTERRLRKAISLRQKRIKLLEEYKQALINEAVTGKIDVRTGKPYPAYKDSGVEWLGKVPEHWEVRHLKRIVSEPITDGPHETPKLLDNGIDFISAEAMVNGRIDFEKRRGYISNEDHEYFCKKIKPQFNDIFMCKSGATTGKVVILDIDKEFSVWSPLALIRVNLIITYPSFTFKALQSSYIQDQVKTKWSAGTQPNLSMNDMKFLFISLPPLPEQAAIVEYLNKRCAKIDSAITSDRKVIELLKEFRTRLIADVVTGKLDVRDVAEKLPEEPEEEMEPIEGETEEKEASEIDALSEEETDE